MSCRSPCLAVYSCLCSPDPDQILGGTALRNILVVLFVVAAVPAFAQADRIRFWNLTGNTITKLYLAPAGTDRYGPDQCANDRDGTVDHRERLRVTGITSGRYDAKFEDK